MKRKIFSVLFALVLVLSLSLVTAVPAAAADLEVGVGKTYATIQEAIDAASPGDTITVAAGTYTEDVDVDVVGITIQGESLEAIVDGGFLITVDEITIDGLTIQNGYPGTPDWYPAAIAALSSDDHEFTNNVIIGAGTTMDDSKSGVFLKVSTGTLIDNNEIYNFGWGIAFITGSNDVTITNNDIHDSFKSGIGPGDSNDAVITHNDIYGNNTSENPEEGGISIYKGSGHAINFNNIYDNTHAGLIHYLATNIDATLNWWGDASGPLTDENTDGTGNSVIYNSGTIASYSPWLGQSKDAAHPWIFCVDDVGTEPAAGYIQTAINGATAGDTINVAAGTYDSETFPIDVNKALTIQSVAGADTTIIDSVSAGRVIAISAAGVTIGGTDKGFTIEGEGAVADGLIYIGANDATITDNRFIGDYYLMVFGGAVSGAMVEDNIFLAYYNQAATDAVLGVYVESNATSVIIDGNSFPPGSGTITQPVDSGIYVVTGSEANRQITISNNTFEGMGLRSDGSDGTMGCAAIELAGVGGITIESNTIVNSNDGIWFEGEALTGDVTIQNNTLIDNVWGIEVKDGVGTVGTITANYNSLVGSTTEYGLLNEETAVTVDARYNWWGAATGPDDAGEKNPYYAQAATAGASKVSTYVTFIPWMIHTDLASGWNIYSTPIASGTSTDTIAEALDLWTDDTATASYYFDSSASPQAFVIATDLTPLQAVYLNMSAAATIDTISSTLHTAPPSQTAYAGWNLIGLAELYPMNAEEALASAYYVAGANNIGYSQVVSPGLGQTAWSAMRGSTIDTPSSKTMAPCEGYWMNMVNQGTLAGFTSTPITELP